MSLPLIVTFRLPAGAASRRFDTSIASPPGPPYSSPHMNDTAAKSPVDAELRRLERRLDELVVAVQQLKEENRALRHRQDNLISERANLLQKNEQVRARVEAMIGRLKSMEHSA